MVCWHDPHDQCFALVIHLATHASAWLWQRAPLLLPIHDQECGCQVFIVRSLKVNPLGYSVNGKHTQAPKRAKYLTHHNSDVNPLIKLGPRKGFRGPALFRQSLPFQKAYPMRGYYSVFVCKHSNNKVLQFSIVALPMYNAGSSVTWRGIWSQYLEQLCTKTNQLLSLILKAYIKKLKIEADWLLSYCRLWLFQFWSMFIPPPWYFRQV